MNIAHYISDWWKEALEYKERVLKDGGTTKREDVVQQYNQMCKSNGIFDSIKFAWLGEAGGKFRDSDANRFWTKIYSLVTTNDATQTTSTSQPYITGNIAPTERIGMKNPNGSNNYMTHPTISFAANEAWSVTVCTNFNFSNNSLSYICRGISTNISLMYNNARLRFDNASGVVQTSSDNSLLPIIGKTSIITLIAKGNGVLSIFINGILLQNINITTNIELSQLLSSVVNAGYMGIVYSHIIRAQALTPSQVAAEANFLRSLYPEIPSVTIGSQVWATSNCDMVATPQGNLIQNVTLNSNVEKITNAADREFSSDTGFWTKVNGVTISSGKAIIDTVVAAIFYRAGLISPIPKWYKVTFTVLDYIQGSISPDGFSYSSIMNVNANGIYVAYCLSNGYQSPGFISEYNSKLSIDNVSIEEIGWAGSTELYNAIYAATAGTVEQKTYAAVKAAAMWRYPNNDSALGAIYNKLYNDYAMKLLAMDIAYYNTANPSTPWGWDIPTEAEWTTLQTTVNNDAEALKKDGTVYWSSPNAGTNSSLFTALPAGYVKEDGTFAGLNNTAIFASKDNMDIPRVGKSIRLIKK